MKDTGLQIQMAPLPATFQGSPQDLADEMVRRMSVVSASGTNFFVAGSVEPTSNAGPWLKDGVSWYVFDEETKRYVPLDISASETKWYFIGSSTPAGVNPPVWLRTTKDASQADPSYGDPIGWYEYNGSAWVSVRGPVKSGPTNNRPTNPFELQEYYDTTISVLIWWERNAWRTVSGVPGDIKSVAFETLTEALEFNPGWEVVGASNQSVRGRIISQATKDPGDDPETDLTVSAGVAERAAFEVFGETDGVQINSSSDVPYPPQIALWHLVKQ